MHPCKNETREVKCSSLKTACKQLNKPSEQRECKLQDSLVCKKKVMKSFEYIINKMKEIFYESFN